MAALVAAVVGGYFLGTFPSAQLVGRVLGFDPTTSGSGNPGASNTTRVGGWKAGAAVLVADLGKGAVAAGIGWMAGGRWGAWLAGAAAVAGHVFPVTRGLRGGKGVATGAGVALVTVPVVALVLAPVFAALVKLTRIAAVGSIAIAVLLPVGTALTGATGAEVAVAVGIGVLVVVRHVGNIQRIVSGTEHQGAGGREPTGG